MANNSYTVAKKPLTKEELRLKEERRKRAERRRYLAKIHDSAVLNMRERQRMLSGEYDDDDANEQQPYPYPYYPYQQNEQALDKGILSDFQNMKFCRKPVGFLMNIVILLCVAIIAISFISIPGIPALEKYTAMFMDGEAVVNNDPVDEGGETENNEENEESGEEASNAVAKDVLLADGDDAETPESSEGESGEEAGEGSSEEGSEEVVDNNTYYKFSDPIFGWISFIGEKFGVELSFGESSWYDSQIMKVQTGMADNFAAILIQAFPAALILYVIIAFFLSLKVFICWASGDRRIFRHTCIDCIFLILFALVVVLGGLACSVDLDGTLDFGGIVGFITNGIFGAGGFALGYGALLMLGLPVVGLLLSCFLLEKKLRSREITQPIVMYEYKEKGKNGGDRRRRR